MPLVDADRARELLTAERERIGRALAALGHQDDGEENDEFDPANVATDLYQDELNQGLAEDLRAQLEAVERAEARLAAGTYGLSDPEWRADRRRAARDRPDGGAHRRRGARTPRAVTAETVATAAISRGAFATILPALTSSA